MGHFVFLLLHVAALLFGMLALFITIPLHLLYSIVRAKAGDRPTPRTHVRCPDCKELVRNEARKCKHCGAGLVTLSVQHERARAANVGKSLFRRAVDELSRPR